VAKKKPPHPDEVENNGHFPNKGGFEIYKLLYGLQGRVSKLEGGFVLVILLLGAILAKLQGAW